MKNLLTVFVLVAFGAPLSDAVAADDGAADCKSERAACVQQCDLTKSTDDGFAKLRYPLSEDAEERAAALNDIREAARTCRRNCNEDFNACMGSRPQREDGDDRRRD